MNLILGSYWVYFFAQSNHLIVQGREIWGLFTSIFMHADAAHLIFNMISLFIFGIFVENNYTKIQFLLIYFISGLIGSIFSFIFYLLISQGNYIIFYALGSSGAIYGLMAAAFVKIPRSNYYMYIYGIIFVGYRLLTSLNNWAHLFGFAAGFIIARIFIASEYKRSKTIKKRQRRLKSKKTIRKSSQFPVKEELKERSREKILFDRFCRLIQIENPMPVAQMAEYLQLDEVELMKRLIVWKQKLPINIDRENIYIPDMNDFLTALDRIPY